jgi:GT2 family glycosyltransferase
LQQDVRSGDGDLSVPAVSVVVPAYSASRHIAGALDSIVAQHFRQLEVIVVNDGSPDTPEFEAAIAPYLDVVRYVAQENRGAGAARNAAIAIARGRYVAFLDADDRWRPDFLERQVAFLDARRGVGLVYSDAIISGDSVLSGRRFMEQAPSCGEVTLESLIAQRCNIILSTVVMRREPLAAAGGFDESLRRGQDFDLWLRLAHRGVRMAYQPVVLAERQVHATGLSGDTATELERALTVLRRFATVPGLPSDARSALGRRAATLADCLEVERAKCRIADGNFPAALEHLRLAKTRALKVRVALVALRIAPRLLRRVCVRARQPLPVTHAATGR